MVGGSKVNSVVPVESVTIAPPAGVVEALSPELKLSEYVSVVGL
jgi:hypothetical protein